MSCLLTKFVPCFACFCFRVVHTFGHNFRTATKIVRTDLTLPIKSDHVLVKIIYAGVNASDVSARFLYCIITSSSIMTSQFNWLLNTLDHFLVDNLFRSTLAQVVILVIKVLHWMRDLRWHKIRILPNNKHWKVYLLMYSWDIISWWCYVCFYDEYEYIQDEYGYNHFKSY